MAYFKSNDPNRAFLIAGPCSAETEEQVMTIARDLANMKIDLFRAGIWKPRTRPGSFEGIGVPGLEWLRNVKKETGLRTTVEVANAQHVYEAMKYGIDVLWIGARTTVNPFSVQEIADALKGTDIPVLIKNPVNPDLELWLGAIERISKAGIAHIGAIHRGFSSYGNSKYRNEPHWEIAVELKRRMPDLPMICDNSHICGNRHLLQEVAQQALDLQYDGLMTEVHCDPDNAWSDAKQQITPARYEELVGELLIREKSLEDSITKITLEQLRGKIDKLDKEVFQLLGARMEVAEAIGELKRDNNVAILQPDRWNEILSKAVAHGKSLGLTEEFTTSLLNAIHQESILHQSNVMKGKMA